ncbi:MAG: DNA replication/repair protein RecF [Gammaproteobacteria bacterium]|nr:DNA replication/repair protein RecF [Gammaproteobacteria bacterium]
MLIKRLKIENFRNFVEETIEPSNGLNLLFGDNAAGKTSTLEAIGFLSTLRSFRSAKMAELIRYQQENLRITAIIDEGGREIPVGLERANGELTLKADGKKIQKASELAIRLPIQTIHPDSHLLISGGPKQRRRFLDWGVFHVEQGFLEQWRRYEKSVRQRNAAIRLNSPWKVVSTWDNIISDAAEAIQKYRQRYIDNLNMILPAFTQSISSAKQVDIEYLPGWDVSQALSKYLEDHQDRDRRRGFTCSGPHRADLIFRVDGQEADKHISRGQQKMLVFSLLLSQVVLFTEQTGKRCVLLLDDLAAELDDHHRGSLLDLLREMSVQTFITCVQKENIQLDNWVQHKLFHVEHGKIREVL